MEAKKSSFDLQGHRGCRGLMPENTIPAMIHAMELGVTTLEMDVVITADSVCILSHEPFFNHDISTKPNGETVRADEERSLNIFRMSLAEVQRFDVGLAKHPRFTEQKKMAAFKPSLAEMLAAVKAWCQANGRPLPFFNIETKTQPFTDKIYHPEPGAFVDLLMATLNQAGMARQTIIQSFDYRTLQYLHQHFPEMKTAALVEDYDKAPLAQQLNQLGFIPSVYSPAYTLVTPLMIQQCREMGIKLVPWTVNDPAEGKRLIDMGVDGLITDYPDRVRK